MRRTPSLLIGIPNASVICCAIRGHPQVGFRCFMSMTAAMTSWLGNLGPGTGRRQRRYDHRLQDLVQRTGDVTIATDLGVPRSTARGWLANGQTIVVSLDVANLKAMQLQQEVLELRRRVKKLTALLRLALALLRSSGVTLTHERLPDGRPTW